jgi:hypothetical protein
MITPDIAEDADLRTCVDGVYRALVDAFKHRRDLPDDIRALLSSAIAVLAVTSVHLELHPPPDKTAH